MEITYISLGGIDWVKRQLKKQFPNVRHCVRLEAFARACGFRSWAALIAASGQRAVIEVRPSPDAISGWINRLNERDAT